MTAGLLAAAAAGCMTMPPADLAIAIASSPDPAAAGTLRYAITVTDTGPGDASGLAVRDRLPDGFTITSASGSGWTCSAVGQDVTCLSPALSATEASQITLVATAPAGAGAVSNTALVTAATPDGNPENNIATAVTAMGGCVAAPGAMTVLHVLQDRDGIAVRGALTEVGGRLYGLAGERGPSATPACSSSALWNSIEHIDHCPGTLFSLRLDGSDFRVDHAFSRLDDVTGRNADGYHPYGSLVVAPDGRLHGVAQMGGTPVDGRGAGVAFAFDPATGAFVTEHSFFAVARALDGEYPMGVPAVLATGEVAGTAKGGGIHEAGTVWRASGDRFEYASLTADIGTSYGGLTLGPDGVLHGTSNDGGAHGAGTYFTVDPATLAVTVVDSFSGFTWNEHGTDNTPIQTPTVLSDGTLVMAREFGGAYGAGLIARLGPTGIAVLREFDDIPLAAEPRFSNATGGMPNGRIVEGRDGMLYGTAAYGGAHGSGGIYRLARDGSRFELLHSFDGGYPYGGLTVGSDGALYGTTFNTGQVFRFVPPTACE